MNRPVYIRRRPPASWRSVRWLDGLTVGLIIGFLAGAALETVIARVFS